MNAFVNIEHSYSAPEMELDTVEIEVTSQNDVVIEDDGLVVVRNEVVETEMDVETVNHENLESVGPAVVEDEKTVKRGKRVQPDCKTCPACSRKVKAMKNHLHQYHKFDETTRKFYHSFLRTQKCRRVFQCDICVLRFTNDRRHRLQHPGHTAIRIQRPSRNENFPAALKCGTSRVQLTTAAKQAIEKFVAFEKEKSVKDQLPKNYEQILRTVAAHTRNFREHQRLRSALTKLKESGGLQYQTIVTYSFIVTKFVEYMRCYNKKELGMDHHAYLRILKDVRTEFGKLGAATASLEKSKRLERVPTIEAMRTMARRAEELLQENLESKSLTYKENVSLCFFLLQSIHNVRPGPLLSLTTAELESMSEELRRSTDHKTG